MKFCISFILYRADSQKARISPDARMLRKLLRDRDCRPVLRGILETLLHYLTQDLPDRIAGTQHGDEMISTASFQRKRDRTVSKIQKSELKTNLMPAIQSLDKTTERETKIPEQPKEMFEGFCGGGDEREEDPTPRRLTTFRLLQSKFARSTPKPPLTNRREVGTLLSRGGMAGAQNHRHDGGYAMKKNSKERKEHKLKPGGMVKDIVAKFALTEQKEMGLKTPKRSISSRQIGKGILLSSLMEKFENLAIVSKGIKSTCSSQRLPATVSVKQRVARSERASDRKQIQSKKVTLESTTECLEANQSDQGQRNPEEKSQLNLKAEQIPPLSDESFDLLRNIRDDAQYCHSGKTQENICTTAKLNYACQEIIQFRCASQWCLPAPYNFVLHSDAPLKYHMTSVLPCSILWSTYEVSSPRQYFKKYQLEASACPDVKKMGKGTNCGIVSIGTDYSLMGKEPMDEPNRHRRVASQRGLPRYTIPHICRSDTQHGDGQHSETVLAQRLTSASNCSTHVFEAGLRTRATLQESCPLDLKVHTAENKTERTFQIKHEEEEDVKRDTITAELSSLELPDSCQTSEAAQTQLPVRPKYTSINYGDPSVKQTYKPKLIRFTDTFTF